MISEQRTDRGDPVGIYIAELLGHDNPLTAELEEAAALRDDIQPFVERETARLISLLIRLSRARKVLELGTGIGYSTVWLGEAVRDQGGRLISIDNHERTGREAERNIARAKLEDTVTLLKGDAETLIPDMVRREAGSCDLIFQDCGKYLYPLLYEDVYRLLAPGGVLVSDDVLFSISQDVRKGLGKHVGAYNRMLFSDPRYYSTLLPVGHGCAVSLKLLQPDGASCNEKKEHL